MVDYTALGIMAVRFALTSSVSKVVKDVVRNNLSDPDTVLKTVQFGIGTMLIGTMAGFATGEYVDAKVKEGEESLAKIQEKLADQKKEPQKEETQ